MAERYIDGMRVFVDGEVQDVPEIGIPIEDAAFEENAQYEQDVEYTLEEADTANAEYERAQEILSLEDYVGYNSLLKVALEKAQLAATAERSYLDSDERTIKKLRQDRIVADAIYHFLRSTVDDAKTVLRPLHISR